VWDEDDRKRKAGPKPGDFEGVYEVPWTEAFPDESAADVPVDGKLVFENAAWLFGSTNTGRIHFKVTLEPPPHSETITIFATSTDLDFKDLMLTLTLPKDARVCDVRARVNALLTYREELGGEGINEVQDLYFRDELLEDDRELGRAESSTCRSFGLP